MRMSELTAAERGFRTRLRSVRKPVTDLLWYPYSSPEYNNSIPGVAKNAIDWFSRPPRDIPRVFGGRPVAIAGASPGFPTRVTS
jgi:chromate reductase, NAD(P)H dehydrogenase (quinone)